MWNQPTRSLWIVTIAGILPILAAAQDKPSDNPVQDYLDGLSPLELIEQEPSTLRPLPDPRPGLSGSLATGGTLVNREPELALLRSYGDVIWPGAVIKGASINNNKFAKIDLGRSGGTITITSELVLKNPSVNQGTSVRLDEMTVGKTTDARQQMLRKLEAIDSAGTLSFEMVSAGTKAEAYVKLGVAYDGQAAKVEAEAEASASHFENTFYLKIAQSFYTVAFDPTDRDHPFFSPDVTLAQIKRFTGDKNPPLYVSEVTYGRVLIMSFVTHKTEAELMAAFKGSYQSTSAELRAKARAELQQTRARVLSVGATGGVASKLLKLTGDELISGVGEYLEAGARFNSQTNPGTPIAMVMRYVGCGKQGDIAIAQMVTDASPRVVNSKAVAYTYPPFSVWDGKGGGLVDTKIDLYPGDSLSITATGKNWSGVFATGDYDAQGWSGYAVPAGGGAGFPITNHHPFALVARLGATDKRGHDALGHGHEDVPTQRGTWFYVGNGISIDTIGGRPDEGGLPHYGRLYLSTNDDNPENGDENKKFQVTVKVIPRDPAK